MALVELLRDAGRASPRDRFPEQFVDAPRHRRPRGDANEAAVRGWPVVEMVGSHLDLVTWPDELAQVLVAS